MSNIDNAITESSGNVFADLGPENADELLAKSRLVQEIRQIIKHRSLTQAQAAKTLDTHKTQISRLNTGKGIDSMSFDLLLNWLTKLDRNVTLTVKRMPKRSTSKSGMINPPEIHTILDAICRQ